MEKSLLLIAIVFLIVMASSIVRSGYEATLPQETIESISHKTTMFWVFTVPSLSSIAALISAVIYLMAKDSLKEVPK